MSGTKARVPAGISTGGRFATQQRGESDLTLHGLDEVQSTTLAPSDEVIDKSLSMSGITLREGLADYSPREVRDAFLIGREMGAAAVASAGPAAREVHAAARRMHMSSCGACHGADQSCIQIEEHFMVEARLVLEEARQARVSS